MRIFPRPAAGFGGKNPKFLWHSENIRISTDHLIQLHAMLHSVLQYHNTEVLSYIILCDSRDRHVLKWDIMEYYIFVLQWRQSPSTSSAAHQNTQERPSIPSLALLCKRSDSIKWNIHVLTKSQLFYSKKSPSSNPYFELFKRRTFHTLIHIILFYSFKTPLLLYFC